MKVLITMFVMLFLWTEMPQASVIKHSADGQLNPRGQDAKEGQKNNSTNKTALPKAYDDEVGQKNNSSNKTALPKVEDAEEGQKNSSSNKTALPKAGKPLNKTEFEDAKSFNKTNFNFTAGNDPTLKAGLFEGDIQGVNISGIKGAGYNAIGDLNSRWANGVIPYLIHDAFDYNARILIASAMNEFHTRSCIRFVPRTTENDYVFVFLGIGCYSNIGRVGGGQYLSLGWECHHVGVIVHELMHAVGFWHEQSRPDRDTYITINWDNIQPAQVYNFQMYNWGFIQALGEAYDLNSIMHYGSDAFALNSAYPTIVPKVAGSLMGQKHGFTDTDIRKINNLYQCQTGRAGAIKSKCADEDEGFTESTNTTKPS